MINYPELFLFTGLMLFGIVAALYLPAAFIEKRWPFREKKNKKVAMAAAPTWPMDKWPHPTPGQGPLPNTKLPKKRKA